MGFHTFPIERADALEDPARFEHCSTAELVGATGLAGDDTVVDVGSGTGFYTDRLAAVADRVYAVDVQVAMAAYYREKGVPDAVTPLAADAATLPLPADAVDVAVSTMAYHELPDGALSELGRVLRPGGRLVVVDWSAAGTGADGPPLAERVDGWTAAAAVADAGFTVRRAESRRETFLVSAVR